MTGYNKVLIANRGEIAVRIIRALKEMNIPTVAVYSEADRDSLHVELADEAYCIGPGHAQESYLNISRLISAAELSKADAIHPGYGFLAEDPNFAEICESSGITYIGPSPQVLALTGNKLRAREVLEKLGLPVLPGSEAINSELDDIYSQAEKIGFPLIIKPKNGGGGKGMRVVKEESQLKNAWDSARKEACAVFNNPDFYLEKYLKNPRHIEIQILADQNGNVIHLSDRDCSIQRRYQKLIEEAPSPNLDEEIREKMGKITVEMAKKIEYDNIGTFEYLLDQNNNYYFIEINSRLQVEHPVTEMITNVDLVKEQLKVAAGKSLELKQDDLEYNGSAIECRINAEDPEYNFKPSSGIIEELQLPGGPGVRVDCGIKQGEQISYFYDPLLAKIITWDKCRSESLKKMQRALDETNISGIKNNLLLYQEILKSRNFKEGKYTTNFLLNHLSKEK